jgi:hypothetical protein
VRASGPFGRVSRLPDTASSFQTRLPASGQLPASFQVFQMAPLPVFMAAPTGHRARGSVHGPRKTHGRKKKIFRSSSLEDWNSGIFQSASGPWPGPESDTFLFAPRWRGREAFFH